MSVIDHSQLIRNVTEYHEVVWEKDKQRYGHILHEIVEASLRGERYVIIHYERGRWIPDIDTLQCKLGEKFTCKIKTITLDGNKVVHAFKISF